MTNLQLLAEQYNAEPLFYVEDGQVRLGCFVSIIELCKDGKYNLMNNCNPYLNRYDTQSDAIAAAKEHLAGELLDMMQPLNQTA